MLRHRRRSSCRPAAERRAVPSSAAHRRRCCRRLLQHRQPLLVAANLLLLLRKRFPHAPQLMRRHRRAASSNRRRPCRHVSHAAQLALQGGHPRAQRARVVLQRRRRRFKGGELLVSKELLGARRRVWQRPVQLRQQAQPLAQVLLRQAEGGTQCWVDVPQVARRGQSGRMVDASTSALCTPADEHKQCCPRPAARHQARPAAFGSNTC